MWLVYSNERLSKKIREEQEKHFDRETYWGCKERPWLKTKGAEIGKGVLQEHVQALFSKTRLEPLRLVSRLSVNL